MTGCSCREAEEAAMRFIAHTCALAVLGILSIAVPAVPQPQAVPQDPSLAEVTVRSAISAWAYSEYWRLYGMGSQESRAALPETVFVEQMGQGTNRPGIGLGILEVRSSGPHALVKAKVRMEYMKASYARSWISAPGSADETVQLVLVYQDGAWRINLHQFVGLSGYSRILPR
jgi:hypothetical protein